MKKLEPKQIKALRVEAGYTAREMAAIFGYSNTRAWQRKEEEGATGRALSSAETEFLLLILGKHPKYFLTERGKDGQ